MLNNQMPWAVTRPSITALPRAAAEQWITMSAFGTADALGAHKVRTADAAYGLGDPSAWSPPV